jgi:hypothetical protein
MCLLWATELNPGKARGDLGLIVSYSGSAGWLGVGFNSTGHIPMAMMKIIYADGQTPK